MALADSSRPDTSITSGVVADLSLAATTPFGCYIAGPTDPLSGEARRLEESVFFETFGNTRELLAEEYGPFDDASVYLVIVDHELARVAGMIRLILDKHGRLKSLGDIADGPWGASIDDVLARTGLDTFDTSETLDGATLAVDPDYRGSKSGGLVSFALYRAMLALARVADMKWFVTIFDVVVLDFIQGTMHKPFGLYDGIEPMRYLDSPLSVPVYLNFADWSEHLREIDDDLPDTFFSWDGLEAAVSPADFERAAEVVRSLTSTPDIDLRDPMTRALRPADPGGAVSEVESA